MLSMFGANEYPDNRVWHDGIDINRSILYFNFAQLTSRLIPLFSNSRVIKNLFCTYFYFHSSKELEVKLSDVIQCMDSDFRLLKKDGSFLYFDSLLHDCLIYDFEKAFDVCLSPDYGELDVKDYLRGIKASYQTCGILAANWFFNQVFNSRVIDFINSNFRYYPLVWPISDFFSDVSNEFILDSLDNKPSLVVDKFPIIGNKVAFMLGEVDIDYFFPSSDKEKLTSAFLVYPCDYSPLYFPLNSYCTFLLSDGNIIVTRKFGYLRGNPFSSGSLAYCHVVIDDVDSEIKKFGRSIYSLNCLNFVVDKKYRDIVEFDKPDICDSLYV